MRCFTSDERVRERLERRKRAGNVRRLQLTSAPVDFASNDYLGLAKSRYLEELIKEEMALQALDWTAGRHGWGSTGSRLLTGNTEYAQTLEEEIARFHGYEGALLFNCGYMANIGLLSAIATPQDTIFFDAAIHASTHDGIRLSRGEAFSFRHNDVAHLARRLESCSVQGDRFICIESIYSTDGSMAPLVEICHLAQKYNAKLIVDEAHATGIMGLHGKGLVADYDLHSFVFAHVATFGKALGVQGAVVLGSDLVKQALLNFATAYIYTTALPLAALVAIKCSYDLFPTMDAERTHLQELITLFRSYFQTTSFTPIQSILIKGNEQAKAKAEKLQKQGIDARALLSPTVQRGKEMIRLCLHAFNTEQEVMKCIELLSQA